MNPEATARFAEDAKDEGQEKVETNQEVHEFFRQNEDFLVSYAQDSSFKVEPGGFSDAQGNYIGFAIDLEKGTLFADPRFFSEKGYSPQKAMVGFLHELEHLREMAELLGEKDGAKAWQNQKARFRAKPRLQVLDNCVADVRENRSIQDRAPAQKEILGSLYREDLFPENDLRDKPLHLQFAFAVLRDQMITEELVMTDPRVRAELDRLEQIRTKSGQPILGFITRPDLPPSLRLKLQEQFLEPVYEKFFTEDVEKEESRSKESQAAQEKEVQEKEVEEKESEEGEARKSGVRQGKAKKGAKEEDYFKAEYKDFFDRRSPRATPKEKIDEAVKEFQEKHGKSEAELLAEAYARAEGVDIKDIRTYQDFWQKIEDLKNPETDESVVEELRKLFRKIIAERTKSVRVPKIPTTEGQVLFQPVRAYLDTLAGKDESLSWLSFQKKERPKELYGQFDITWVVDRSGSMNDGGGQKRIQQKIGTVLGLEAIKEFCDDLDNARSEIQQDLEVRTEVWSFGSGAQVEILKPLSKELTEKQRVAVFKKLDDCPGSTMDFAALEQISNNLAEEDLAKISESKLRKIVIVETDGGSDNAERLKSVLKDLRNKGVVVVAVGNGIAKNSADAKIIRENYKLPDGRAGAQICPGAEQTPIVLADLLKIFLTELM